MYISYDVGVVLLPKVLENGHVVQQPQIFCHLVSLLGVRSRIRVSDVGETSFIIVPHRYRTVPLVSAL
jgi:hypothetical protein